MIKKNVCQEKASHVRPGGRIRSYPGEITGGYRGERTLRGRAVGHSTWSTVARSLKVHAQGRTRKESAGATRFCGFCGGTGGELH